MKVDYLVSDGLARAAITKAIGKLVAAGESPAGRRVAFADEFVVPPADEMGTPTTNVVKGFADVDRLGNTSYEGTLKIDWENPPGEIGDETSMETAIRGALTLNVF